MKKHIIYAAAAAACAAVTGIVTGVIVSHRDRKKYERLQDDHIELMEDYANTMEEFTDYIRGKNGCDREDFIFEEDNEDE